LDNIAAADDILTKVESSLFLQETLSLLTPQQQKVITATVLEGGTEQEMAKELGMSQLAIHQMKERALNRLKRQFKIKRRL